MENNTKPIEAFVDTNQMLSHLKLSRAMFELLVVEGLPLLRIGKARRFKISQVEDWLKSRERKHHEG
jgi:hypothetical protein